MQQKTASDKKKECPVVFSFSRVNTIPELVQKFHPPAGGREAVGRANARNFIQSAGAASRSRAGQMLLHRGAGDPEMAYQEQKLRMDAPTYRTVRWYEVQRAALPELVGFPSTSGPNPPNPHPHPS